MSDGRLVSRRLSHLCISERRGAERQQESLFPELKQEVGLLGEGVLQGLETVPQQVQNLAQRGHLLQGYNTGGSHPVHESAALAGCIFLLFHVCR